MIITSSDQVESTYPSTCLKFISCTAERAYHWQWPFENQQSSDWAAPTRSTAMLDGKRSAAAVGVTCTLLYTSYSCDIEDYILLICSDLLSFICITFFPPVLDTTCCLYIINIIIIIIYTFIDVPTYIMTSASVCHCTYHAGCGTVHTVHS